MLIVRGSVQKPHVLLEILTSTINSPVLHDISTRTIIIVFSLIYQPVLSYVLLDKTTSTIICSPWYINQYYYLFWGLKLTISAQNCNHSCKWASLHNQFQIIPWLNQYFYINTHARANYLLNWVGHHTLSLSRVSTPFYYLGYL